MSVLLPVRDAAATLDECLASLCAQTLVEHEVVAVDDGSRDDSRRRLERAARADPRLRVIDAPCRGLVAALNVAAAVARAPLLARMDADDVAARDRLERQAERLVADPDTSILGSRVELAGPAGAGMRRYVAWQNRLLEHDQIVADMLVESPLVHPSVMMRARALAELGGYRERDGPEDYDLWLRAWRAGYRFAKLPRPLLVWRDRPERLTRTDPRYSPARFRALKLEALEAGPLASGRSVVIWGAGPIGKGWAKLLRARGHPVAAFVEVAERRLGRRIHGAPVVPVAAATGLGEALHLSAVGQPGARDRIRAEAARLGLAEALLAVA